MAHKLEARKCEVETAIHNLADVCIKKPEDLDCLYDDILDGEYEDIDMCGKEICPDCGCEEDCEGQLLRLCIEWQCLHDCIWATHHHMEEYHAGEEKYGDHAHKHDHTDKKATM